jgi:hypothetical protein
LRPVSRTARGLPAEAEVQGDAEQPGAERRLPAETREGVQRAEEGLLDRVFARGPAPAAERAANLYLLEGAASPPGTHHSLLCTQIRVR